MKENQEINPADQEINRQQSFFAQQVYSSPLPPPEVLQKYEKLDPNILKKVIELTELQSEHRRKLEFTHLQADIEHVKRRDNEATRGQYFALIISLAAIGCGTFLSLGEHQLTGSLFAASGIAAIVYAFVVGRKK